MLPAQPRIPARFPRAARHALVPAGLVVACLAAGCDIDRAGRPLSAEGVPGAWRWRPVRVEVSPLTTPIPALGERRPSVDVRIVFRDDGGDEAKAVGLLRVSVREGGTELATATVDLAATDAHARTWDAVTETYAVPVTLPADPAPRTNLTIRAFFEGADGARMDCSGEVRWPERAR